MSIALDESKHGTRIWERGACRGVDSEIMFPIPDDEEGEAAAKRICAGCLARPECLEDALANRIRDGVWGGATEKERRHLQRQRSRSRSTTS